jgi:hypothetical protein
MKQGDAREEAMAQWDTWQEILSQIKDLEYLMTTGNKFQEEYLSHLAELREVEVAVRNRFERLLRIMRK